MNTWLPHPLQLESESIRLLPLDESHFDELISRSCAPEIWTYMPVRGFEADQLREALKDALRLREQGEQYPFVIQQTSDGQLIGSTRFLRLNQEHRNLEIGYTWFLPTFWGNGYNELSKWLLLNYCFETLQTSRVQLIASDQNIRSRKAIEHIGATFEGVLRSLVIRNGEKRNVAYYSILEEEWSEKKSELEQFIKDRFPNLAADITS